jgi:hypothetical protein
VHKKRNVKDHLAEQHWPELSRRLAEAYTETDCERALALLKKTAAWLAGINPDAAASLREGMEETLTVVRLGVHADLRKTLDNTNVMESAFSVVEQVTGRVKRWRPGDMRWRWCVAGLLHAEQHFRRVDGYRHIPALLTTLVAKELGVSDDPSLAKILRFVRAADVEGNASPFDISYVVKLLHARHPDDPHRVIEWALVAIEAKYQEQLRFFTVVKPEFDAKAKVEEVAVGQRRLRIVAIDSDEDGIHKYARSEYGARAAIVIQRRSSGNVAVFGNKQVGVDLREAAKLIRMAERQAKGLELAADDERMLAEGYAPGAEEWFYHKQGQMLLNGSLTQADVPATRLSLERIAELVKIGVDPARVKPLCESTGRCMGEVCDWYAWSLARCVKLRRPASDQT